MLAAYPAQLFTGERAAQDCRRARLADRRLALAPAIAWWAWPVLSGGEHPPI